MVAWLVQEQITIAATVKSDYSCYRYGIGVTTCSLSNAYEEKTVFRLVLSIEADAFIQSLPTKVSDKIRSNMRRIQKGERNIDLFKKLEGTEICEFRTLFNKTAYRLFAFWDTENETLVIATHGIIKKTQKTPPKEIAKAEQMRKLYFELKKQKK